MTFFLRYSTVNVLSFVLFYGGKTTLNECLSEGLGPLAEERLMRVIRTPRID